MNSAGAPDIALNVWVDMENGIVRLPLSLTLVNPHAADNAGSPAKSDKINEFLNLTFAKLLFPMNGIGMGLQECPLNSGEI